MQAQISGLFSRYCNSHAGKIRIRSILDSSSCSATKVRVKIQQLFQRIPCLDGLKSADNDRFSYVTKTILPKIERSKQNRTLLFIPSYFDFVRVRNWLIECGQKFVAVHEYARQSEVRNE